MRAPAKLAAYGAVLAIVVAGGAAIGAAAGPIDVSDDEPHDSHAATSSGPARSAAPTEDDAAGEPPGGLAVAQRGYRLDVDDTTVEGGEPGEFRFRVLEDTGAAVTRFDVTHEKRLHLVVVGRNLVDYAHVHPTLAGDGTWSVELPALPAGSYRAFADFTPTGDEGLTLGVDLTSTGPAGPAAPAASAAPADLPAPSRHAEVDGYDVTLAGEARQGESELTFTVALDGETVRTEPYLGAAGHLVAIRDGDLAYLHVHPLEGDGDQVRFAAEFPSPGTYRLFLDFAHEGEARTAAFTVEAPDDGAAAEPAPPAAADEHGNH